LLFGLSNGQSSLAVVFLIFVLQAFKVLPALQGFVLLYFCELDVLLDGSLENS
jgi:hypothetical protein